MVVSSGGNNFLITSWPCEFKSKNHSKKAIMKKIRWIIQIVIISLVIPLAWYGAFILPGIIRDTHEAIEQKTSIKGRIKKVGNEHGVYFEMTDGHLYRQHDYYINKSKRNYSWDLKANDSIFKEGYSDTLYIIRGDKTFIYTYRP